MVMVNARDAQAYADWALKKLPTEAQWETGRAIDRRPALSPGDPSRSPTLAAARPGQIDPVMSVPEDVSPYGVLDMGGNALEWTKDWYDSKYYRQLFDQPVDNPTGPTTKPRSLELVVKGDRKIGQRLGPPGIMLEKRLTYVGFRCVLPVDGPRGAAPSVLRALPAAAARAPPGQPPANPPPTPAASRPRSPF